MYPEEVITLPINGEPQITSNNFAINQDWCKHEMIDILLNNKGTVNNIDEFYGPKKPVNFELNELIRTLKNFLESFLGEGRGLEDRWLPKMRQKI